MTINDKTLHGHERFDELAAMGQLHALTALEQAELTAHLHNCAECREAFQQYQVLSKRGFVELSADYSWSEFTENWDEAAVRGKLSAQVKEDSQKVIPLEHRPCAQTQSAGRAYMTWMLRGAAAACIALVAGDKRLLPSRANRHKDTASCKLGSRLRGRSCSAVIERKGFAQSASRRAGPEAGQFAV